MYEHLESFITAFIGENGMCHKMPRERIVPSELAVTEYLKRLGISKPQESEVKALVKALSETGKSNVALAEFLWCSSDAVKSDRGSLAS